MEKEPLNLLKKLEPRLRRLRISFHTWLDEILEVNTKKVCCQQILGSAGNTGLTQFLFSGLFRVFFGSFSGLFRVFFGSGASL